MCGNVKRKVPWYGLDRLSNITLSAFTKYNTKKRTLKRC
jgi:predicted component of type VI protein secretion system